MTSRPPCENCNCARRNQQTETYTITRRDLIDILINHQATSTSGCICGGVKLGYSHPAHVADQIRAAQR